MNGEHQRLEHRPVFAVKRTVDEDLLEVARLRQTSSSSSGINVSYDRLLLISFAAERAALLETVPVLAELLTTRRFFVDAA
jgi:hypothetical protein